MRKRLVPMLGTAILIALAIAPTAQGAFGIKAFDLTFNSEDGLTATQAGSHPFAITNKLAFNTTIDPIHGEVPDEAVKDLEVQLPEGLVGEPAAVPRCSSADFIGFNQNTKLPKCPNSSAVGHIAVKLRVYVDPAPPLYVSAPVYNLIPPPGVVQKLGFIAYGVPVAIEFTLNPEPPYNIRASLHDIAQPLPVFDSVLTVWGNPADPAHDPYRGSCIQAGILSETFSGIQTTGGSCPSNSGDAPFITAPRACTGPLTTTYRAAPWQHPQTSVFGEVQTHDDSEPPIPQGFTGCSKLGFAPTIAAQPTTKAASSPTGLDFSLDVKDEGLTNPEGLAGSDIRKAVVTLPKGFSANASLAEGLNVCSEADLARETPSSPPGAGCPDASKIGTVEVETPLLDENVNGALYIAAPYDNEFGSLLALYLVIKNKNLGIIVKQAMKIEPDPQTGQLVTTADDIAQLPFSHFKLHFREGARSPLVSPPGCGTYEAVADLTPWAGGQPITTTSAFTIITGAGEAPCPSGGTPPFRPGFEAGALNNNAGAFSPFYMRLTRNDGDQDLTKFSAKLPPGMVARLAGTAQCSDAAIAAAKARTGQHGGAEEQASPSCPAASQIGKVLAGAGVGAVLTYVPGKIYLAGPYHGAPLSVVAIVPALAGPFDVGTVVTRQALRIDPSSAEVTADGASSDPIPHILAGIPLNVRDIRVSVDKPDFTINPTNCEPFAVDASLWGGGNDVFSVADDVPVSLSTRFQAANCASLGFKPKLDLKLKGGTKRGGHPGLTATYTPRSGDANVKGLVVRLPRSAFLDQAHIRTICTRVQFAAKACPKGAQYGFIKAWTPLLDEPLEGPVYLRSSSHKLPDLVFDLHGLVDIEVATRIDSAQGGIRASLENLPDAPLSKVLLNMQGQKKGLIINSRDLCGARSKANVDLSGQNGKQASLRPVLRADCGKAAKGRRQSK